MEEIAVDKLKCLIVPLYLSKNKPSPVVDRYDPLLMTLSYHWSVMWFRVEAFLSFVLLVCDIQSWS